MIHEVIHNANLHSELPMEIPARNLVLRARLAPHLDCDLSLETHHYPTAAAHLANAEIVVY